MNTPDYIPDPDSVDVLWRGEEAVAIDKLSGLLIHNSAYAGPPERTLVQIVSDQMEEKVYPIHRLDRGTSGVVIFSREKGDVFRAWHTQLGEEETAKVYLALTRGRVREEVMIDHGIKSRKGVRRDARSHVAPVLVSSVERCSLVRVRLFTGRTHQARRHLKHISHPIVGDTTYGKGNINRHYRAGYDLWRLALHAWHIAIDHPETGERLHIEAPLPEKLDETFRALFPAADLADVLSQHRPA